MSQGSGKLTLLSLLIFIMLFGAWSVFSSVSDTVAKTVLSVWNFPITMFLVTMLFSVIVMYIFFHFIPLMTYQDARKLVGLRPALPIALAQTLGFLLTYMSYGKVSISFAQTLKSTDPLINLIVSVVFFSKRFPLGVYLAILPIVLGVALTSTGDAAFSLSGFVLAITSTVCFVLRTLIASNTLKPLNSVNVYYFLSWASLLITAPLWLALEAPQLFGYPALFPALNDFFGTVAPAFYAEAPVTIAAPALLAPVVAPVAAALPQLLPAAVSRALAALAVTPAAALLSCAFFTRLLTVAGAFFVYNMVSYAVMMRVPPLTHSVCNVTRRIGVIVSSIIWFGNVPTVAAVVGMVLVFLGVGLYMYVSAKTAAPAQTDSAAAAFAANAAATAAAVDAGSNDGGEGDADADVVALVDTNDLMNKTLTVGAVAVPVRALVAPVDAVSADLIQMIKSLKNDKTKAADAKTADAVATKADVVVTKTKDAKKKKSKDD